MNKESREILIKLKVKKVETISQNYNAKFKENPWKAEGKILVGFLAMAVVGLIAAFFEAGGKAKFRN